MQPAGEKLVVVASTEELVIVTCVVAVTVEVSFMLVKVVVSVLEGAAELETVLEDWV